LRPKSRASWGALAQSEMNWGSTSHRNRHSWLSETRTVVASSLRT